ncbi:MAG: rhomboid family intramembrane serine protease [Aquabacterium sp.]|uniref:rhomboid family intramembrane serine protease n=1 Tax=Aquabacterium sp. TaxID=1872578 RepID=UPI001DEA69C2|nr:rhomboid family intramembrane serine protease [Aquabacterium sp.]MBT9608961.1 rhomboid family intramembrane serine protease [Aquabacterium sp.]
MTPSTERPGLRLWWALCLALALPTLLLNAALRSWLAQGTVPLDMAVTSWPPLAQALVLRPDAGWVQSPWVWWSSAWLHGSTPHLLRNLAGLALMAALGTLVRPSRQAALAGWLAWPLTQLGMLMQPSLDSYVGLSGVLHAGVTVLALHAAMRPLRQSPPLTATHPMSPLAPSITGLRWVAIALLLGLAAKVLMENPWGAALVASTSSAINVAPWAHLSGCAAGALATWGLWVLAAGSRLARRCH